MTQTATATDSPVTETRLDRMGIPNSIKWGFLAVLIFMTGNGVESNFISPHLARAVGDENLAATVISIYGISVLVGSYLSGALSDLFGPKRVMLLGFLVWIVFEAAFLLSIQLDSTVLIALSYFFRGFGFPLFAFSFLVWINHVTPRARNATAVGWFYVMFTGGMPTLGSLVAILAISGFGGGNGGETGAMIVSSLLVLAGFLIAWFGVREPRGLQRLAPAGESAGTVILGGLRVMVLEPRIFAGFCVRLINTAPQFGMFVILPAVMVDDLGWSQNQWLLMTTIVFAGNISFNALFGYIGDQWGWIRTVRWFGIVGSALGLLAWWYVPHMVEPGSTYGYWLTVIAGTVFGILLAGFVPMGAVMPNLTPQHKGAAMAMYTTAAGGAAFLGSLVVAVVRPWGGDAGVVWAFVVLYGVAFALTRVLKVPQVRGEAH
ncbi:MFS transporter [Kocuria palustris]|jgi:MFS family permease|uniref:RbtT/DalT/CsbX family MFS transporter n=1 Tax=Kocuria TaxID=57493 RepID=UPI0006AA2A3A|nr:MULTISPECIES: RbtT/DalT/CsbX family MFS transporter [Kocuria]ALB02399.1 arabinose ABC transporter permease [Kocuria palustris]MBN6752879.1 MFS transporter [Kocuria palustris]MBN6757874.1 MFS transporter [Kocuria palustris]MBN6762902.1 MFS transporter [Kocuria palustris]MBN6782557.1 MFS transporter [Kocuria palustris]